MTDFIIRVAKYNNQLSVEKFTESAWALDEDTQTIHKVTANSESEALKKHRQSTLYRKTLAERAAKEKDAIIADLHSMFRVSPVIMNQRIEAENDDRDIFILSFSANKKIYTLNFVNDCGYLTIEAKPRDPILGSEYGNVTLADVSDCLKNGKPTLPREVYAMAENLIRTRKQRLLKTISKYVVVDTLDYLDEVLALPTA
mgnify:CR=1 FL=1|tara:strand:- start:386 stop:985 length:600 start_codon:yes stop_codon:yes gene_type:complete